MAINENYSTNKTIIVDKDGNEFDFKDAYNTQSKDPSSSSGSTSIDINSLNEYVFIEQSYKGTGGFKTGYYLIAHQREAFYSARTQLSYYTNFVNPILRAMFVPVFTSPVKRDYDDNKLFEMFKKDVNYNNLPLQNFTEIVAKYVRLHSITFIVMDYILPDDVEITETYLLNNDVHPYAYIKKAYEVENYILDFFGRLTEITFIDECQQLKKSDGTVKEVQTYIRWSKDKWERVIKKKDKYIAIETRILDLGSIPVSPIYEDYREDTKVLLTESKFYSLTKINHTIFNQDSERRELQRNQTFSILCIQEDKNDVAGKSIGTTNYLRVSPDVSNMPQFISPDTNILKELQAQRDENKKDLFTLADQLGVIGISKAAKSGVALSYEFSAYEATLQKTAEIAIRIENEVVRLFQLYTNTDFEYVAHYNTEYTVGKDENKIIMYDTVNAWTGVPATLNKSIMVDTQLTLFPETSDEDIETLEKEMDDMNPELENDVEEKPAETETTEDEE